MPSSSGHSSSILSLLPVVRRGGDGAAGSARGLYGPQRAGAELDPALWDQYASVVADAMRYAWTWKGLAFPDPREGGAS